MDPLLSLSARDPRQRLEAYPTLVHVPTMLLAAEHRAATSHNPGLISSRVASSETLTSVIAELSGTMIDSLLCGAEPSSRVSLSPLLCSRV